MGMFLAFIFGMGVGAAILNYFVEKIEVTLTVVPDKEEEKQP